MGADVPKVLVTRFVGSTRRCPLHDVSDTVLGEIDEGVVPTDLLGVLVAVDVALDVRREIGIARFSAVSGSVLPLGDTEAIVLAVLGPFDMPRSDLRDLEAPEADVAAQLDDEVIAVTRRGPPKVLEFVVGQPDLLLVILRRRLKSYVNF